MVALKLAVAFFGSSIVFPLSPFFLRNKLAALGRYAVHRPRCLIDGHPPLDEIVARAESKHRVPRGLLAALVQVESNGHIHRISSAKLLGVSDPFDPLDAIDGSSRYLAMQLATFRDVRLAVAAYNAGPGAIVNRTVPQNGETEFYVRKVMSAYGKARPLARSE
jgi:soluble lytic murein transglycosylase-like protein